MRTIKRPVSRRPLERNIALRGRRQYRNPEEENAVPTGRMTHEQTPVIKEEQWVWPDTQVGRLSSARKNDFMEAYAQLSAIYAERAQRHSSNSDLHQYLLELARKYRMRIKYLEKL